METAEIRFVEVQVSFALAREHGILIRVVNERVVIKIGKRILAQN